MQARAKSSSALPHTWPDRSGPFPDRSLTSADHTLVGIGAPVLLAELCEGELYYKLEGDELIADACSRTLCGMRSWSMEASMEVYRAERAAACKASEKASQRARRAAQQAEWAELVARSPFAVHNRTAARGKRPISAVSGYVPSGGHHDSLSSYDACRCGVCGKRLKSREGAIMHRRSVHGW